MKSLPNGPEETPADQGAEEGRDYALEPAQGGWIGARVVRPNSRSRPRLIPPRPGLGERGPRPYSGDDLDSLLATCLGFPVVSLVTLTLPSHKLVMTWEGLRDLLRRLREKMRKLCYRSAFPRCVGVTEFACKVIDDQAVWPPHFHIGFDAALTVEQRQCLEDFWLKEVGLSTDQGSTFHYRCNDPHPTCHRQLQMYLAKDFDFKTKPPTPQKIPPDWVPRRVDMRLWFCVGHERASAARGRALRRKRWRRRRFGFSHGDLINYKPDP